MVGRLCSTTSQTSDPLITRRGNLLMDPGPWSDSLTRTQLRSSTVSSGALPSIRHSAGEKRFTPVTRVLQSPSTDVAVSSSHLHNPKIGSDCLECRTRHLCRPPVHRTPITTVGNFCTGLLCPGRQSSLVAREPPVVYNEDISLFVFRVWLQLQKNF